MTGPDFIEVYEGALSSEHCSALITAPSLRCATSGKMAEFFYQQRKIVPRVGSLLIAPTAWTHTHRGNRPLGRDKYIATSWVLYKRAENLFGANKK